MDILHFDDELVILQRSATELVIYCRLAGIAVTISWPTHNGVKIKASGLRAWLLARGLFIECFCGFTSHRTERKPCRFVVSKVTGDVFGFCHYAQARCLFKINLTEVHDTCLLTSEYPDLPTLARREAPDMDILLVVFTLHGYPHQDLAPHFEGYAREHNSRYPAGTHQLSGPLLTRRPSNAHGGKALRIGAISGRSRHPTLATSRLTSFLPAVLCKQRPHIVAVLVATLGFRVTDSDLLNPRSLSLGRYQLEEAESLSNMSLRIAPMPMPRPAPLAS
ncbi:hypothetical protein DFH08DRAFT_967513 [Mycena albidolilacea]|uniref:Uncharacterized protein n=1 Tax=Mycena albidolilacea TaxID=1033008 RepID=A0AAD6ZLY0_9AGAR|nr:hypothetical protein DFH08DRAFT_967513 [Mycena albidolilacea]